MHSHDFQPNPRQTGFIIGGSIENFGRAVIPRNQDPDHLEMVGISDEGVEARYILLMACAALATIESSGLDAVTESQVALGVYDWARLNPSVEFQRLWPSIESLTDQFSQAAADDELAPPEGVNPSQLELELFDQLMALGEQSRDRARACMQFSLVLPKYLWEAQQTSTIEILVKAGLLDIQ